MKNKVMLFAVFALLTLGLMAIPSAQNAQATGGTTGSISAGVSTVALNVVVSLTCYNMEAEADYSIDINDTSTYNWTNSAEQTSRTFYHVFTDADILDGMIKVELVNGSYTTLDTVYLGIHEVETFFPIDAVLDLLVPLVMFGIAIAIVGTLLWKARQRGQ